MTKSLSFTEQGCEWMLCEIPADAKDFSISDQGNLWFKFPVNNRWHSECPVRLNIEGTIAGYFTPSTNENTTTIPTEALQSAVKKQWPLTENNKFGLVVDVNVTEKQQQYQIKKWREAESQVCPSRLLVIQIKK